MDAEKPGMNEEQLDAILQAMGGESADSLLAELLGGTAEGAPSVATKPGEIRARVKEMAMKNPELIIKIINHWLKEDRMRGKK